MGEYTCQCTRCDGTGKFDRGTCFDCKGAGYRNRDNTRGLMQFILTVTYSNGTQNSPRVFATSRKIAVQIVERQCRVNGWDAIVK